MDEQAPRESHVGRVIALYEGLSRRDLIDLQRRISPDVVLHVAGRSRFSGTHDGMGQVIALASDFENRIVPFGSKLEAIDEDGDEVNTVVTLKFRLGPYVHPVRLHERFRFDGDGRVAEIWLEAEDQDEVDGLIEK